MLPSEGLPLTWQTAPSTLLEEKDQISQREHSVISKLPMVLQNLVRLSLHEDEGQLSPLPPLSLPVTGTSIVA